ncbi:Ig-like domain-containing protein [Azospirillum formosense]|uniref:Ig-like domain-containing protein n=1 Tax=Azospirillum formosense TaxID=861533 RepID=UPI00338EAA3B
MTEASAADTTHVTTSGRFPRAAAEIAVIDTALAGWRDLQTGLPPGVEAVLIGEGRDGVAAMAQALSGRHGVRALHVLCHGFEGGLQLGTARLDEAALSARGMELAAIGACLGDDGDILLYGCNVASGHGGSFLDALADITGAAMAASRTLTGAAELGGDWTLGWTRGTLRTEALRIEQYRGVLAAPFFDDAVAYTGENTITMRYDDSLDATSNPLLTHFVATDGTLNAGTGSILINGNAVTLISAVVSDSVVTLTVGHQFQLNDAIAFRYEDPAGDDLTGVIQAPYGLDTHSVDVSVTVLSARPPAFLSSSAQIGTNKVVLSFDQALDANNPPSTQQFFGSSTTQGQIRINGVYHSVSSVAVVGSTVTVEVGNGYIFQNGDAVSLRYYDGDTVDSTTAIQNQAGVDIPDFRTSFTVQLNAPTVTATGNAPTFTQNAAPVDLFSGVAASTNTGQVFTSVTLTVTNVVDDEWLSLDGIMPVSLTSPATGVTVPTIPGATLSTSYSGTTATVTLSGFSLTNTQLATLIDGIAYVNSGDVLTGIVTPGNRVISITNVTDDGSSNNTSNLSGVSSTVVVAAPAPVLQSAAVNGASLVLTYDVALDSANPPAAGAFTVTAGGSPVTVSNVAVDGANKTVTLTLAQAVTHGNAVTVSYADPTVGDDVNAVQSAWGGIDAATITAQPVTNDTPNPNTTPPTLALTPVDAYAYVVAGNPIFDLFNAVSASTMDSGQTFTGMVLTVHNVAGTGSNEFLTIAGTDIALSNGSSGSFTGGNYAVTLVNGVATVAISGMALSNSAMNTLVDGIAYKTTSTTVSSLAQYRPGLSETRPVVLRSITDSGSANNTTEVNKVATASFGTQNSAFGTVSVTPDNPTATFIAGTPTQVSFTVNISSAIILIGTSVYFDVAAPAGWTIANLKLDNQPNALLTGIYPVGTLTLTFDVTASGTDTTGVFPISIFASQDGMPNPTMAAFSSGSVMVTLAPPAPVLQSATVDGTALVLTYDTALDAANGPTAGAFEVKVGGSTVTVSGVAVNSVNKTVTLTLAQAVQHGQTVTVSYTDPTSGNDAAAIQNATGGADAASVTNRSVTNSTPDTTPPSITNVSIPNQPVQVGDTVTVTITVAADSDTYTLGSGSTVGGFALANLTKISASTYTATFTVTADGLRTGNRAAGDDIPVNIVLVDGASNANAPYTTPISQTNDRIDTDAPPVLAVPATPPTLVDTAAADSFPLIDGQLAATDLEGGTLTFSIAGSQASPVQHGSVTLGNGVTYDTWSTGPGGTAYVNSQTGHYAYVFDAAFLNGVPAGPMQGTSTFTVSDGNRTVSQQLTLNFTGANDSPILSNHVRSLAAIDQGIADAANTGTTVTALLASAGTATDAEYDSPVPMVTVVPLGIAVTGVTNTNGTWQYKVGTGAWTDIPTASSNGAALLLAGSDRVRFVPSGSGFANTDTGAITFKAWDRTSGTPGATADTAADAFSTGGATATIAVDAVPTLTATGGAKTFGVGVDSATSLFSGVAASTVEAGQSFRGAEFTVAGVVDATEVLTIGGTDVALVHGATATLSGLGVAGGNAGVSVSVVGGVARVTVSGLERDDAQMSALLGGVTYKNTSATATLGDRTVAIAGLTDSGGATGSAAISGIGTVVSVADVTPPAAPVVTSAALTKSATPVLTGTAEAGSTVTVTVGGATYTTTATGGAWSIDLATATPAAGALSLNANGANAVSVTAKDASNNTSTAGTQTLTIDTTPPGAPAVTSAALTKNAAPTLTGTAEAGSTVTVTVGGATYTTTATGGGWSIDLATATPTAGSLVLDANGTNAVAATATDAAGNVSPAGTQTLTIDTTAPNAPTVTSATLTNSTAPTLTGIAETYSTVTVTVGGATYTTTATGGGWSIDLATATPTAGVLTLNPNGANPVAATATDAAGNTSSAGTHTLTIDTTAPNAPTVTSATLTNSTAPTLTGIAETYSTVTVTVGGATYTTTASPTGTWSINLATATPTSGALVLDANGANSVSVTATDAAGNTSSAGTQSLTIDTTLPGAPAVTSATLTNSATPTIAGTAEAGSTVTVTVGGATYTTTATGGSWSVGLSTATPTAGVLTLNPNGANPVAATATDAAGNVSAPGTQTLTIDTTAPNAPAVTSAVLTNSTTPTLTGTAEAGSTVTVTVGGATYTTTATGGSWSIDLATATPASGALSLNANGANPVAATATDAAGNVSTAGTQSLTIDTTAPTAPTITTALANSTTPTLTGTAEAGSTVTVTVGGATYTTTATGGSWSVDLSTATPTAGALTLNPNGANPVSATATDAAGNTSSAGTQSLTIDTTLPNAPAVTSAALTKNATPTIAGTAEAGSTVTVTVGGATYTTTATGGSWSVDLSTATPTAGVLTLNPNGANPIAATATDAAGNVSAPGTQTLTIDTTPPGAPAVTSAVLTNSTTPTLTGTAEAGSTVTVTVGGATYTTTATGGNWSIDLATATPASGALSLNTNGANPISATATDAAGNVSPAGTQSLVVDTTLPDAPTVTSAALSNSATPTLTGIAEAGSTVTVTVGGATYTTTATGGTWSVDLATATPTAGVLTLNPNGANPVSATATDASGNVSAPGTQTLTIDTTKPDAPTVTTALTNSTTPTLTGTAEAGSTVTVTVGGATYTTTATGAGAWSLNLATAIPAAGTLSLTANAANPVSVTATDAAGNTSPAGTRSLVVDTTPPTATVLFEDDSIDAIEQTGAAFTISGGEAGAAFTWTITSAGGGQVTGSGVMAGPTARVDGLDLSGLGDGTLTLTLGLSDPAGNASPPFTATTQKLTATVDKPAPVAPPAVATVDGATVSGAVTTGSDGSRTTTVTIAASNAARVEDSSTANPDLADVPVVREQVVDRQTGQVSTQTTLTVSVSTGVAVTATGSAERQTAAQALSGLSGLIAAIEARTDAGTTARGTLTGGGSGFLSVLSTQAQLLVRAIDFSAPGVAAGQAVQTRVTGSTLGGTGPTSTAPTAVVLNTAAVAGPVTIQLDNVEFAAVVGNATLVGGDGEQIVYGDDHEQFMHLGAGDDILHGGGGNDTITSAGGNDTLYGDDGDDLVHGGEDDDWLVGGAGNDLIGGGTGNDRLFGGTGNDVLFGEAGNDTLTGEAGNDTLSGGTGDDLLFGEAGDDLLLGDEGDDTLSGGAGNDTALGGAGNDLIGLGTGNDLGLGGDGNDTLFGEEGDDTLFGGAGNDVLHGGAGNDLLFADGGADTLWGGAGADVFAFGRASGGSVVMDFQAGVDRLALYDAGLDLGAVIRSARVEGGSTTLDLGAGNRITILGQTGNVAAWFA